MITHYQLVLLNTDWLFINCLSYSATKLNTNHICKVIQSFCEYETIQGETVYITKVKKRCACEKNMVLYFAKTALW